MANISIFRKVHNIVDYKFVYFVDLKLNCPNFQCQFRSEPTLRKLVQKFLRPLNVALSKSETVDTDSRVGTS